MSQIQKMFFAAVRLFPLVATTLIISSHLSCKSRGSNTDLKAEGLTRVQGRSPEEVISLIKKRYPQLLTEKNIEQLNKNLTTWVQATFQISCPEMVDAATGYFIDGKGFFVTAGHVMEFDQQDCEIKTVVIEDGKFVHKLLRDQKIDIYSGRYDGMDGGYDIALGRVLDLTPKSWIEIPKKYTELKLYPNPESELFLGIGFPQGVKRSSQAPPNELEAMNVLTNKLICSEEALAREETLFQNKISEILKRVKSAEFEIVEASKIFVDRIRTEHSAHEARTKSFCAHKDRVLEEAKKRTETYKSIAYDSTSTSAEDELFISAGVVYGRFLNSVFTDVDANHGSNGGPLISLQSGQSVGTMSDGLSAEIPHGEVYVPFSEFQRIDWGTLTAFKKDPKSMTPSCWCKIDITEEIAWWWDKKELVANDLSLIPEGASDKKYYCSQKQGVHNSGVKTTAKRKRYYTLRDCKYVKSPIASSGSFYPGRHYRVYDPDSGAYLGRPWIDPAVAKLIPIL